MLDVGCFRVRCIQFLVHIMDREMLLTVRYRTLTSLPIAGSILTANQGDYTGLIIFAGLSYIAAIGCLVVARVLAVGWDLNIAY